MKLNPTRYSSAVGEVWVMATFKIKYCHKIFDILAIRLLCLALLNEALQLYKINCKKIAFDSDHVHMIIDMGLYSKPQIAKNLRGYIGSHLLRMAPWLKANKWEGGLFWNSGLWNPAYDIRNISDLDFYMRYLDRQKYSDTNQTILSSYQ